MSSERRAAVPSTPVTETGVEVSDRTQAAWGHRPPDMCLRGASVLLASGEVLRRDVAIVGSGIVAVAEDLNLPGELTIDLSAKTIVPGYVEPHSHTLGPLSTGSYCGAALARGTSCVMSDDSFAYTFMSVEQYGPMLDISERLPMILRWSLRLDRPRSLPLSALHHLIERTDVGQLGELMTRPLLDELPAEIAELIAHARALGLRIEGHSPGASGRTLAVAAAAGVTADHESQRGEELLERLRAGMWAFIRYTDLLRDAPTIVAGVLERGISLERTAFTTDWSLPPWIVRQGVIDGAIRAALQAGLRAEEAYACATRRPASYMGLDAHLGVLAPGRLANLNVLEDLLEPLPSRVFSLGREVARDGELLVNVPDIDWHALGAPAWSELRSGPPREIYRGSPTDPVISLESASMVRLGSGSQPGGGEDPIMCLALDPKARSYSRAAIHGLPSGLEGIVSTLTPQRLLIATGADPAAIERCVEAVIEVGGGIAYQRDGRLKLLPLPVGGVLTDAPFAEVLSFWESAGRLFAELGHALPDPICTLLYLASSSLPGARFTARGLLDTRRGELIEPARPLEGAW
jgi:adenine deaminase